MSEESCDIIPFADGRCCIAVFGKGFVVRDILMNTSHQNQRNHPKNRFFHLLEPFLMHFLAGTDFTKLLKIIDRTTMKYKHLDGYTPLMMIVVNPNITNFEKTVVIDRLIEMGCDVNRPNDFGETALMMAVKRNNRKMMEYLLENGASPNISDNLGVTPLMIATFNSQLYNMAVLHFFNAQLGATCSSYELDVFDIPAAFFVSREHLVLWLIKLRSISLLKLNAKAKTLL